VIDTDKLKQILEAALLAADEPLTVDQFVKLFRPEEVDAENIRSDIREALKVLEAAAAERGYELVRVASGYRYQVRQELSQWVSRLWEEKPPRYSRALLETLALVAYRQPVTRGDIEDVRGVSVSQSIMRTLIERGWIRVVGQREVPGRPAMYGTTRAFLDYFNLKSLDQLPPLAEIRELIEPVIVAENEQDAAEASLAEPAENSAEDHGDDLPEEHPEETPEAALNQPPEDPDEADRVKVADVEVAEAVASVETESSNESVGDESEEPSRPQSAEVVQLPTAQH
jgi:segregation and condensation protein B